MKAVADDLHITLSTTKGTLQRVAKKTHSHSALESIWSLTPPANKADP
jgi:DNA-binding CsgD family transcriptional regulator